MLWMVSPPLLCSYVILIACLSTKAVAFKTPLGMDSNISEIVYAGYLRSIYWVVILLSLFWANCIHILCSFPLLTLACSLPNTFQSWFLIAHLHVWLCLVRLKREGKDGSLVIREVVSTFWYDVQQRMAMLGVSWWHHFQWYLTRATVGSF